MLAGEREVKKALRKALFNISYMRMTNFLRKHIAILGSIIKAHRRLSAI